MVGVLRGAYGRHVGEPAWEEHIRALAEASADFRELWARQEVAPPRTSLKVFRHAAVGGVAVAIDPWELEVGGRLRLGVVRLDDRLGFALRLVLRAGTCSGLLSVSRHAARTISPAASRFDARRPSAMDVIPSQASRLVQALKTGGWTSCSQPSRIRLQRPLR